MTKVKNQVYMEKKFRSGPLDNPQFCVGVGLSKQIEPHNESFDITVWGDWGEIKNFQFDLPFDSKKDCIAFLKECVAVLQEPYDEGDAT
jgi:hypothetical protein